MAHERKKAASAAAKAFAEVIDKIMARDDNPKSNEFSVWFHAKYPTIADKAQAVDAARELAEQATDFYLPLVRMELIGARQYPQEYAKHIAGVEV